jgi:chromate transporter
MTPRGESCDLASLALASLRLGVGAFGGLGATIALINRDFVDRRRWLDKTDLSDALAFTKPLPGSTGVQVVAFLGWRLGGWPGAIVAALGFLAPAIVLMTLGAALTFALPDTPLVRGALTGLQVAVVGVLAAALVQLARSEAASPVLAAVLVLAFLAGFFVNAALIVVGAGVAGILYERRASSA